MKRFEIVNEPGRNYLHHHGKRIAQCVNGDYEERFGGEAGWLMHIEKRTNKRMNKIEQQIKELREEEKWLLNLYYDIYSEMGDMDRGEE